MQRQADDPTIVVRNVRAAQSQRFEVSVVDANSMLSNTELATPLEHPAACTCPGCLAYTRSLKHPTDGSGVAAPAADPHDAAPAAPAPAAAAPVGPESHAAPAMSGAFAAAPPAAAFAATDEARGLPAFTEHMGGPPPHLGDHILII